LTQRPDLQYVDLFEYLKVSVGAKVLCNKAIMLPVSKKTKKKHEKSKLAFKVLSEKLEE
jgi:hypothetical protein